MNDHDIKTAIQSFMEAYEQRYPIASQQAVSPCGVGPTRPANPLDIHSFGALSCASRAVTASRRHDARVEIDYHDGAHYVGLRLRILEKSDEYGKLAQPSALDSALWFIHREGTTGIEVVHVSYQCPRLIRTIPVAQFDSNRAIKEVLFFLQDRFDRAIKCPGLW